MRGRVAGIIVGLLEMARESTKLGATSASTYTVMIKCSFDENMANNK